MSTYGARTRNLRSLAAIALVTTALVGCSGASSPTPAASASAGAASPSGAASAAASGAGSAISGSITWWGWSPLVNVSKEYIAAFNKDYPNIQVTFKQIQIADYDAAIRPALASSVGPDVYDIAPGGGIGSIASYGSAALDLKPMMVKALGSDWQSKIAPIGVADMTTSDGKLAGASIGSTFAGTLWINQDIFSKYSLTPPKTLDQWVTLCKTLRANSQGCFLQGAGQVAFNQDTLQSIADSIQPGYWTKASKREPGTSWNDPVMVQALTIWKQLFTDGIMDPGALGLQQYPDANNAFLSGKTAMVMMGTWYMQNSTTEGMTAGISGAGVANPKPFTAIAIPFPDVAGKGNPSSIYGNSDYGLAINSKSKNQDAAAAFVTWMTTSTAGQQVIANALNEIASLKGVEPAWSSINLVNSTAQQPVLQKLIADTGSVSEPRLSLISADLQQAIGVASTTVVEGQATPEQAAATLEKTVAAFK